MNKLNMEPLITIITVVYNGKDFIEETILSVIEQRYGNVEYIVVDGGSTDGTLDIIKKYESDISNWISEPDRGIYDAMNKGIKLAKGTFVNFLNAGDSFVDRNVLNNIFLSEYKDSTLLYGDINAIKENGESIRVNAVDLVNDNSIKKGMKVCHQAIFYHKDILYPYDDTLVLKAEWKHLVEITRDQNFKPYKFNFPIVNYLVGGVGAQQLKLNQKEYREVFLDLFGIWQYLGSLPFFAYMFIRRQAKGFLKR
ncbi:glycosyltransferase family 2 protein [Vibrio breoganii]|uniref:glycosyltransferase family 2 protein n=1 Tax=Vibrio breoganii TaxID=553239 RepID=UPI0010BD001A|nr:glycosyltransferase family 2 protein [Vibrio breoganii]TKG14658.1 glycosyltransferase [Vibrio breoganii]